MESPKLVEEKVYTERTTCRACDRPALSEVLNLGVQYLPRFVEEIDEKLPKAPLALAQCDSCGLLQLRHSVDPDLLYREFWYRTSINATMRHAMDDLVASGLACADQGSWLDIGANDGYLLSKVPDHWTRIACEPAVNFEPQLLEHAHVVIPDYFSKESVRDRYEGECDVITSAACFYDVSDPASFVRDVQGLLSPEGVWINQLNDSPTMLEKNAFDAICHEHVCYYDVPTLKKLYASQGMEIVRITHNDVNGGSVRVFAMKRGMGDPADLSGLPDSRPERAHAFARRVVRWKEQMWRLMRSGVFDGTWLYGASTKGSTLLQYLDCNEVFLACADRNPKKWGLRMAGSWIPITDEASLRKARPRFAMVLPWAFRDEFLERETKLIEMGTSFVFPLPNLEIVV